MPYSAENEAQGQLPALSAAYFRHRYEMEHRSSHRQVAFVRQRWWHWSRPVSRVALLLMLRHSRSICRRIGLVLGAGTTVSHATCLLSTVITPPKHRHRLVRLTETLIILGLATTEVKHRVIRPPADSRDA